MPRIRSVHPDICVSEAMAHLGAELERTFVRLWTHCDDEGRCEDRPKILKAALYPLHDGVTAETLDRELEILSNVGLLQRYEADGKRLIQVTSWDEYQHPQKPRRSKYAPPPDKVDTPTVDVPEAYGPGVELEVGVGEGVETLSSSPEGSTGPSTVVDDAELAALNCSAFTQHFIEAGYNVVDVATVAAKLERRTKLGGAPINDVGAWGEKILDTLAAARANSNGEPPVAEIDGVAYRFLDGHWIEAEPAGRPA